MMESTTYRAVLRIVKLLNLALMTAAALCCWCLSYAHNGWDQTGL